MKVARLTCYIIFCVFSPCFLSTRKQHLGLQYIRSAAARDLTLFRNS